MNSELKSCPFCGSEAEIYTPPITIGDDDGDVDWLRAQCTNYCAFGPQVGFTDHRRQSDDFLRAKAVAINTWNRRNGEEDINEPGS